MFVRASKARVQPETYRQLQYGCESLHLPWLCPALYRVSSRPRESSTSPNQDLSRRNSFLSIPTTPNLKRRGFASAAPGVFETAQDDFVPFENLQRYHQPVPVVRRPWLEQSSMSMRDFDPRHLTIINEALTSQPPKLRSVNAISGEVSDIIQTMHACVQVGRLERAALMMRRLNNIYKPDTSELLAVHNEYLRELVHKIVQTKDQTMVKDIHKWFELDLRGVGVIPDASTYALMIQAALQESNTKKGNRTIKRYVLLADEAGVRDEAFSILQILCNDQDFGRIAQIAPSNFNEVDQDPTEDSQQIRSTPAKIHDALESLGELPAVKETTQKGLGLIMLKRALASISKGTTRSSPDHEGGTEEERGAAHALKRQQQLEIDTYDSAISRWRALNEQLKSQGLNAALKKNSVGASMWDWHESLVLLIKEDIRQANKAEGMKTRGDAEKERCLYGPFLQLLPAERISAITILTCMNTISSRRDDVGVPIAKMVMSIGQSIQDECITETIRTEGNRNPSKKIKNYPQRRLLKYLIKERQSQASISSLVGLTDVGEDKFGPFQWTLTIKARLGAILLSHLINTAKIDVSFRDPQTGVEHRESQRVFLHSHQHHKGRLHGIIRFNKAMYEKLSKYPVPWALSKHMPMLVEPRPWKSFREGAFFEHRGEAVRIKDGDAHSRNYATAASDNGDMDQIYSGLDVLARTAWRINRQVFEVMLTVWNSGDELGKLAPENPSVDIPPEPPESAGDIARRKWMREIKRIENYKRGVKSQRCFQNFQLEIARTYIDETFYFPHNIDFRGRAYPMVPFFNHMGADPTRGLLMFSHGKELGERGLRWLKIHLANLYGFDKANFEERRKFTDDHLSEILDSATNPLEGKRWWLQADDPWQCLATCMELNSALKEPDPARFISRLPIHQDGTCNGLQHYAALGGDVVGAKQVNLEPGDRPSDIYTGVAEMIKAEVADVAAGGHELAALFFGNVSRKVVKQTLMTNVYGVTLIGAKKQVRAQLDEIFKDRSFPDTRTVNLDLAAHYIVKKIFTSLSNMFNGAHEIQQWFGECVSRITSAVTHDQIKFWQNEAEGKEASSPYKQKRPSRPVGEKKFDPREFFKSVVVWTTPLKMPVVQPYRRSLSRPVVTNLQRISLTSPKSSDPVDKKKQLQAFPPNFIHSLDATHMLLTALKCSEKGLTFAAVHDSFWTHAGDIDIMNMIIRDAFIRLHSEDIMGRLAAEFNARYKDCLYLATVERHSAIGRKIHNWRVHMGNGRGNRKLRELLLESRRLQLLASDNPEKRLEGESMDTAGKFFEEMANETEDLTRVAKNDINGIGHIPKRVSKAKAKVAAKLTGHDSCAMDSVKSLLPDPTADTEQHDEALHDSLDENEEMEEKEEEDEEGEELEEEEKEAGMKVINRKSVWIWRPIKFPPVPDKGDFDVNKLRHSPYFFS